MKGGEELSNTDCGRRGGSRWWKRWLSAIIIERWCCSVCKSAGDPGPEEQEEEGHHHQEEEEQ